jgi:PAS domain S-box-containing protein
MKMSSGICSILLCDREGRLHCGAAPHLPDTYNQAIEGMMTGEGKGSCGTAAFRRELVIVTDIATDPLWQDYAALALAHGLRACWSLPVLASDGTVLATFAVYHHDIHYPEPQEILVIQRMADLTKIAIESEQSRQALRQLNQELEIKVIERTAALQESEAQLRDLFDNATDLIQSIAPDGRILFVNQAWKTALGYKESEIKQLSIFQIIHPDELEHCRLVMQRLFDGEECEGIETRFVTKAGQEIILEGNVNCRRQDGQAVSTRGILRNVTERRQAEVQLKRQLAAIEAAVDGIAILQGDQYIYVNSSHLSLFGYSCSEDLIGKSWQCLYSPEEILRFEQEVFPVLGTHGRWEGEAVARRKDGTTFVEGLSMTLSEDGLLICVCRDITELKEAELQLQRVNADLQRSNQELEQFAYIASHDLQEPLRAISGYTQLLKQEYVEALSAPMAQEYMGFVMDGAQRMRLLIQDLLAYSRVGSRPLNLSNTDSNAVLADVLSDLQTAIAETNAIITADPLPTLPVDRIQLMQIFQNLISNALKFRHEDPPHIHIRAGRRIESKFGAQVSSAEQESSWLFSVQDNGIGIKPQYLVRVFDIFRRLHSQRKFPGTGIGLALCKKAVEQHGGEIWAESEPEMGTTFYFTLPTVPRQ